jgi:hypothetical protein
VLWQRAETLWVVVESKLNECHLERSERSFLEKDFSASPRNDRQLEQYDS